MSEQEPLFSLEVGVTVKVFGIRGVFTVTGANADGSVQVYGGTKQQFRSFVIERLRPVKTAAPKRIRGETTVPNDITEDQQLTVFGECR